MTQLDPHSQSIAPWCPDDVQADGMTSRSLTPYIRRRERPVRLPIIRPRKRPHVVEASARPLIRKRPRPTPVSTEAKPLDVRQLIEDILKGRIAANSVSVADRRTVRSWCREIVRAKERLIWELVERGCLKSARREMRQHLASMPLHLHSLFTAARREWRQKRYMSSAKMKAVRAKAFCEPFARLNEVGHFHRPARGWQWLEPKPNGGHRLITSFHWVDRARQYALRSALTPFADLHGSQYLFKHGEGEHGPAAVRRALLQALEACGQDHLFLQFDVRGFYGSISHAWLERHLRLGQRVIRSQLHAGGMNIRPSASRRHVSASAHLANREKGQRSIPEGSLVSPIIAEQVMADVLKSAAVFSELPCFVWSDNVGMIVPRSRVGEIERLVRGAFVSHEAGPFQLTMSTKPVTSEFKFLGVWYRKERQGARAYIPQQVRESWIASIEGRVADCLDIGKFPKIEAQIRGKAASWAWYEPIKGDIERLLTHVRQAEAELF